MKQLLTITLALLSTTAALADWSSADDNLANRTPFQGTAERAEVRAVLNSALITGDVIGAHGVPAYFLARYAYPPRPSVPGKSRAQVQFELAEAIRTGEMLANNQSGLTLAEQYPSLYARTEKTDDASQVAEVSVDDTVPAR